MVKTLVTPLYVHCAGALLVAAALVGCQQERNTNAAVTSVRDVPAATTAAATTSEPAKVPAGDPSLPPASTATTSGGTDGAATALTDGERKNALPLEGQVNNYSSDAFAKRGTDNVPRDSSDAPRGNEAVSTPNSNQGGTK
jgi:hypothetical protein